MRLVFACLLAACAPASKPVVEIPAARATSLPAATSPPSDAPRKQVFDQSTPIEALASFVRAYSAQRWDVLVRFAPNANKEGITPEKIEQAWKNDDQMLRTVDGIRRALEQGVRATQSGDHAVFEHSKGTVLLVDDDGAWKIKDFTE